MRKGYYRTTYGTIGRVFEGKKYSLSRQAETKDNARAAARGLRKQGYLARVVRNDLNPSSPYRWLVFRRAKRQPSAPKGGKK